MAIRVQMLDESGAPLPEGIAVELLREGEVVASSQIGAEGRVTFESDASGKLAVRVAKSDDFVRRR